MRQLPLVGQTLHGQGPLFGRRQGRQQHRRQNGNNRNDHQQLNQRKTCRTMFWVRFPATFGLRPE